MGKAQKQLSQAEIWDDSALLKSWDDALQEYKLYHSIHARGERVEDAVQEVEDQQEEVKMDEKVSLSAYAHGNGDVPIELEDGELKEDIEREPHSINKSSSSTDVNHPSQCADDPKEPGWHGVPNIPDKVISSVKDEALKNLMMSWYYAGYYTGLYEGQKQRAATAAPDKTGGHEGDV